jgi:hypothetical protein
MSKVHLKVTGVDCRNIGQTEFEYLHQTSCGYVRKEVSAIEDEVTCFYCLSLVKQEKVGKYYE